jgi:hypothetical protein
MNLDYLKLVGIVGQLAVDVSLKKWANVLVDVENLVAEIVNEVKTLPAVKASVVVPTPPAK